MQPKHLTVERSARYHVLGSLTSQTEQVWLALHGYGMLAQYFAERFQAIANETCAVVVPEAMQRFYLQGTGGRVGASWMTREDREADIRDNLGFLERLTERIEDEAGRSLPWRVLGFSQGFPTAARWAIQTKREVTHLIAWGSDIPEDTWPGIRHRWAGDSLHLVIATDDPYITEERVSRDMERLKNEDISPTLHRYNGGHRILEEPLLHIASLCS